MKPRPDPIAKKAREQRESEKRKATTRVYKRRSWLEIRRAVLSKHPICQAHGCSNLAIDVDHIDGDRTNMREDNLQGLCRSCHSRKTARENGGFGNPLKNKNI